MKIVVLDGYTENPGDLSWNGLEQLGELTVYDRTDVENTALIVERIGEAEVVITNKTPIRQAVIDQCSSIKFIALLATGFDVVDIEYARAKNIAVSNVPAYGTKSVSQFAIALLLAICNRPEHHSNAVYEGRWSSNPDWCFWDYPLIELDNKTIGIIGFGRIGRSTARIAAAMGMNVLAYDIYPISNVEDKGYECVTLDELLMRSDVIVLHCPLTDDSYHLINHDSLSKMKQGVIIINNSRGALIHDQALAEALKSGKVCAAGLDVVEKEPISEDNPLLQAPNCLITPHISWVTKESRQRIMDTTIENVQAYMSKKPINIVN